MRDFFNRSHETRECFKNAVPNLFASVVPVASASQHADIINLKSNVAYSNFARISLNAICEVLEKLPSHFTRTNFKRPREFGLSGIVAAELR
ncbi:hypothetical protein PUN28_008434 [Cardiocondyla obscurior]|uniref:Uncharacterized protein n=1 Tax=Cardiocondyla obscurior TaxID=286306 RepID=A0AAW2FZQ3_9HYME